MRSVETNRSEMTNNIKEARVSVIGPMLEGLMKFPYRVNWNVSAQTEERVAQLVQQHSILAYFNHQSMIDPGLVVAGLLRLNEFKIIAIPASENHYKTNPLIRLAEALGINIVPIIQHYDQDKYTQGQLYKSYRNMMKTISSVAQIPGSAIIIAPEGTRHKEKQDGFQSGIFRIGRQNPDLHYLPIYFSGKNKPMGKSFLVGTPIEANIGEVIEPSRELLSGEQHFLQTLENALYSLKTS